LYQTKADKEICSLCTALNALQEDHANLQDKFNTLSHTTSQKLATQAVDLNRHEHQVELLTTELCEAHEAATTHSAEVLHLQSQVPTQADVSRHNAEEASWSVLRAELTHQAEHMRQLETMHACAKTELSMLYKHHTAIEVLCEENGTLEHCAASVDELCETVVHLEVEVEAAHAEHEA
jgi:seryl-tRNA synthetase